MTLKPPNCLKCKKYFVTWDSGRPHGCRLYSFKSRIIPSTLVKQESGEDCFSFEEKSRRKGKHEEDVSNDDLLDLNDNDLW